MSESETWKGNGVTSAAGLPHSLGDHGRRIQHDAENLAAAVQDAAGGAQRYVTEHVTQHPYGTLGAAVAIGYVLGGGLSIRLTTLALGVATRFAMALAARELSTRFLQGSAATVHSNNTLREHPGGQRSHDEN